MEAGAWYRILYPWFLAKLHPAIFGGVPQHDAADVSWEAQADLEEAMLDRIKIVLVSIGYF